MQRPDVIIAGHFGELMQGRLGAKGPVVLISLPCPVLQVAASASPAPHFAIHSPQTGALTQTALLTRPKAHDFLRLLGQSYRAKVVLRADMPLGGGAGSSTAALVALAQLAGWNGPPAELARACLAVEGASDPLMYPCAERLLWASRRAEVMLTSPALPAFDVVGGFYGSGMRTDPADLNFPDIGDLLALWQTASLAQDLPQLADLAAQSAQRSLALRGGLDDPTAGLACKTGALGHVIAHTGSARGLIFARGGIPANAHQTLRDAGFRGLVSFSAGGTG